MTELQYAEEALKDSREFLHNIVVIKWALVCIAVNAWGLSLYFLLKYFLADMYLWRKKKEEDEFGTHKLTLIKRRKQDGK